MCHSHMSNTAACVRAAYRTYGKWPSSRDGMLNTCGETTPSWMRICGGSSCCTRTSPAAECGFECARDYGNSGCGCIEKIRPASRREPAAAAAPPPPPRARPPALPGNILAGVAADANAPQRVRTISYILVRPQPHLHATHSHPYPSRDRSGSRHLFRSCFHGRRRQQRDDCGGASWRAGAY